MNIVEFLEARIAEDEAAIERRSAFPHAIHGMDEVGAYNPQCPDCLGLPAKARVLAECKAKRVILKIAVDQIRLGQAAGAWKNWEDMATQNLHTLAAVYVDHPDYREEWRHA